MTTRLTVWLDYFIMLVKGAPRGTSCNAAELILGRMLAMKAISHVAFFRGVMLLPFVLPLCAYGVELAGIPNIFVLLWVPLAYGGAPYIIFAGLAWRWMRGKTRNQISAFGILSPLLFVPFQVIFELSLYLIRDTALVRWLGGWHLRDCFEISYFVLIFGYGYVLIGFLLWGCLVLGSRGRFRFTE